METNKFIKQYQLEIKELFERDYHLVDSDEEFVRRLVVGYKSKADSSEIEELEEEIEDLEKDIAKLESEVEDIEADLEDAEIEISDLKEKLAKYE